MTSATTLGLIDLKQTFFNYPELSKISGEPTLGSLMTLRNELKANTQLVTTTLGGGANGHLGLVLSAQAYELIAPGTPYIRPVLPVMDIDNNDTRYIIAQKCLEYDTDLALYREYLAMERILIQQIVNAVDGKYLEAICSKTTNKINKTIPQVLTYLFETYGDVSPQELMGLRAQIENMTFDPTEPVDSVFTEIEDFADIAESIDDPITTVQKCKLAYIVLQNTKKFKSGLREWDRKTPEDKTWDNFQAYFRDVQKQLRQTGDLTIDQAMNNEELINFVSDGIVQKVQQALETSQSIENDENIPPPLVATQPTEEILLALTEKIENLGQALATIQQKVPVAPMQQNPYCTFIPPSNIPYGYPQYSAPQPPPPPPLRPMTGTPPKPARWKFFGRYCHSCGACDHWGSKCLWKKPGHINKATFKDKKGESIENCKNV